MKRTVAIVRGGPSSRFAESLKTGKAVASALAARGHRVIDVVVDRAGSWLRNGAPVSPHEAIRGADVAWNAAHGEFGEDGQVQRAVRQVNVPLAGSGSVASALSLAKHHARAALARDGVRVPVGKEVRRPADGNVLAQAAELFRVAPMPAVVKPAGGGFSRGVVVVQTIPELVAALEAAYALGEAAVVEDFIRGGREATVGVVEGFRGESLYCLPAAEVCLPQGAQILTEEAKAAGVKLVCPGVWSDAERQALAQAARAAHVALGLRHISRVDLIVHPKRGVYVLEVNANPELGEGERFPRAAASVGADLGSIAEHVVELAVAGR